MPWVRIDENATDHPKFIAISANAFRLWVEGMTYCQKHLTDGLIPRSALKGMRYYSPAAAKLLTASLVPGKGPLWHVEPNGDMRVHDYLEVNDSRETVLKKRADAKDRMRGKRSREHSTEHRREQSENVLSANTLRGVECRELRVISDEGEGGSGETSLTARAGAFCEWYADKHQELFGYGYMGTNRDYTKAIELCKLFTDQELREAAIVWFGHSDKWATDGTRSVPKFASRVSGCLATVRKVTA